MEKLLTLFAHVEPECGSGDFLGFPAWFKYLHVHKVTPTGSSTFSCDVAFAGLNDVWKVAAAIFELLLRLGALVAAVFIFWGAFNLIMAQGEPERIKHGKSTIVNAIGGLVIAILAATVVSVVARRLG